MQSRILHAAAWCLLPPTPGRLLPFPSPLPTSGGSGGIWATLPLMEQPAPQLGREPGAHGSPLSLLLAPGSTRFPWFSSRSSAAKGLILAQVLRGLVATAGVCDVEEARHGCPSGPYSCWQAEEEPGKD